jgi:hypothetical protein
MAKFDTVPSDAPSGNRSQAETRRVGGGQSAATARRLEFERLFADDNALRVIGAASKNLNLDKSGRSNLAAKIEAQADQAHVRPDQAAFYRSVACQVREASYNDMLRLVEAGWKCFAAFEGYISGRMQAAAKAAVAARKA